MPITLLARFQVEQRTRLSRSTIYRMMARGEFPLPYKLMGCKRAVGWREDEIEAYIARSVHATLADRDKGKRLPNGPPQWRKRKRRVTA